MKARDAENELQGALARQLSEVKEVLSAHSKQTQKLVRQEIQQLALLSEGFEHIPGFGAGALVLSVFCLARNIEIFQMFCANSVDSAELRALSRFGSHAYHPARGQPAQELEPPPVRLRRVQGRLRGG